MSKLAGLRIKRVLSAWVQLNAPCNINRQDFMDVITAITDILIEVIESHAPDEGVPDTPDDTDRRPRLSLEFHPLFNPAVGKEKFIDQLVAKINALGFDLSHVHQADGVIEGMCYDKYLNPASLDKEDYFYIHRQQDPKNYCFFWWNLRYKEKYKPEHLEAVGLVDFLITEAVITAGKELL